MMITPQERNELTTALSQWLNERGWTLASDSVDHTGRLEVWIRKQEAPPALGVHIRDGIGADDKVGG